MAAMYPDLCWGAWKLAVGGISNVKLSHRRRYAKPPNPKARCEDAYGIIEEETDLEAVPDSEEESQLYAVIIVAPYLAYDSCDWTPLEPEIRLRCQQPQSVMHMRSILSPVTCRDYV